VCVQEVCVISLEQDPVTWYRPRPKTMVYPPISVWGPVLWTLSTESNECRICFLPSWEPSASVTVYDYAIWVCLLHVLLFWRLMGVTCKTHRDQRRRVSSSSWLHVFDPFAKNIPVKMIIVSASDVTPTLRSLNTVHMAQKTPLQRRQTSESDWPTYTFFLEA